ncbi:MAG: hypothetical protein KAJ40_06865 [Alphaproteobacteria bacterium]|nr:hypothetical protein [Alphaproteobacteria bacterium]
MTILSYIFSKVVRLSRVAVLGFFCLSLGGCVEGVDLPEFITNIGDIKSTKNGRKNQVNAQKDQPESKDKQQEYSSNSRQMRSSHTSSSNTKSRSNSEALLKVNGNWNIVVEQDRSMDPTQAHLKARERVNVKRRNNDKELSAHFEPDAKSGEDRKMRVLRVKHGDDGKDGNLDQFYIVESSVVKPSHTIAGSDLLQKIKALFGEDDAGSKSIKESSKDSSFAQSQNYEVAPFSKLKAKGDARGGEERRIRTVNGVVIPPSLPERRIKKQRVEKCSKKANSSKCIIIPRRKPVRAENSNSMVIPHIKPRIMAEVSSEEKINNVTIQAKYAQVVKVRTGLHKGRTRLVIEVTDPVKYKVALDHVRNVLCIKIENTHWTIAPQKRFDKSALLGTYIAREQSDRSVLFEVRLKKESKILNTMLLRPSLSSAHRIVIDMKD